MRGVAVPFFALIMASCGGRTDASPVGAVSLDAGAATDGNATCGPGEQLCDVCGTLDCHAGACPVYPCFRLSPPCPTELPETGNSCDPEGAECGYVTATNACGAANCDCGGGAWTCAPTCIILPTPDAGSGGSEGGSDRRDAGATCPAGQTLCLEGCFVAFPVCVVGSCPPPPPCIALPPDAATCPSGQFMCEPCSSVPPTCEDAATCVPDPSCDVNGGTAP